MKLVARGLMFTLTGTLDAAAGAAYEELCKLGQEVRFSSKTRLLIYQKGYSAKPEKARQKGIPVIDGAQLIELVRTGELEVESPLDGGRGARAFDELLGEVRSLVSHPRCAEAWDGLHALVDACAAEHQPLLVDYINAHLSRWSLDDQLQCKAPHAWLLQMIDEQRSPKFALVRAIDFFGEAHRATKILRVLRNPALTHMLSLNMHVSKGLSATLLRLYSEFPSCQNLVEIGFGALTEKQLASVTAPPSVTRLIWSGAPQGERWGNEEAAQLMGLHFMRNIDKISCDYNRLSVLLGGHRKGPLLRDLRAEFARITHVDLSRVPFPTPKLLNELFDATPALDALTFRFETLRHTFTSQSKDAFRFPSSIKEVTFVGVQSDFAAKRLQRERVNAARAFALDQIPSLERVVVRGYHVEAISQALLEVYPELPLVP